MDNKSKYYPSNNDKTVWDRKIRHQYALFYNQKGAIYADEGDFEKALEYFSKAIHLNPLYAIAYFNRATIKADLGDFKGAKEDFLRAKNIEIEYDYGTPSPIRINLQDEISFDRNNFL